MIYRKNPKASSGWDNGDIDVAFQLFQCGMVWDGNLTSKSSRDHLVEHGYAVRHGGMQAMTGKGAWAFLTHHQTWISVWKRRRNWKRPALVATPSQIARAMN